MPTGINQCYFKKLLLSMIVVAVVVGSLLSDGTLWQFNSPLPSACQMLLNHLVNAKSALKLQVFKMRKFSSNKQMNECGGGGGGASKHNS